MIYKIELRIHFKTFSNFLESFIYLNKIQIALKYVINELCSKFASNLKKQIFLLRSYFKVKFSIDFDQLFSIYWKSRD